MGTTKSRFAKIEFVRYQLQKAQEKEKGIPKSELIAKLMMLHCCSKQNATEIINSFIDSKEIKVIKEKEEDMLYG